MSSLTIGITGIKELQDKLNNLTKPLEKKIDGELMALAGDMAGEMVMRAPGDQGLLHQYIGSRKIASMRYAIYSNALYSAYVEFGTRTKVNIPAGLEEYAAQFIGSPGASILGAKAAIFAWCERKGIEKKLWYPIFISIMVNGTKPHPFFFPTVTRFRPIVIGRIKKILSEATA